jgi:asparagine synthase (glutamine-hydrolysing)
MSGLAGGELDESTVQAMIEDIAGPGDDTESVYSSGNMSLGVVYPEADPHGVMHWCNDRRSGIIYGAITNLDDLDLTYSGVFWSLFDRPVQTATQLEGGFLIVCQDSSENRQFVVTDKLGSRECFITVENGFQFSTDLAALLLNIDDPQLDRQAVNDMLLLGHMWGDRTLVQDVRTVRPAMVMDVVDGEISTERYWKPSYEEANPNEEYLSELVHRYRQAVQRVSRTLPEEAGIWLSGGLDSRTTAAALVDTIPFNEFRRLNAYTYDANPPTRDNPKIAREIADILNMEFTDVPLTGATFGNAFEEVIDSVDGMIRWNTIVNLSATYSLDAPPSVMMEGMEGSLIGDHLLRPHLQKFSSPVSSQYASEAVTSKEKVDELLVPDIDPLSTLREEVIATDETHPRKQILDIHFRNYYSRKALASNRVMRDFVGTRTPYADGAFLEWCSRLPSRYRKGTFPFTGGVVPYGTSRAKLALCRRISPPLANVIYERTKVQPSLPYAIHVAGFVSNVVTNRLRSKPTYGGGQLADFWIRDRSTLLHEKVSKLVNAACRRSFFNSDTVYDEFEDHMKGANNAGIIAQITTLEYWIQNYLD